MVFKKKITGFSLIELVMMLVILGILSASALPKLANKNIFAERVFFDDTLNAIRYAQKLAVATSCGVRVSVSSNSYTLTRKGSASSTSCPAGTTYSLAVRHPGTGETSYSGSEEGVILTSTAPTFNFNPLGAASSDVTLTVNGGRVIKVVQKTGFVYDATP